MFNHFSTPPHIQQPLQVPLYEVSGKLLASNEIDAYGNSIALSGAAGIYLVEMVSGNERMVQRVAVGW